MRRIHPRDDTQVSYLGLYFRRYYFTVGPTDFPRARALEKSVKYSTGENTTPGFNTYSTYMYCSRNVG